MTRRRAGPIFIPRLRAYEILAALHVIAVFLLIRWVAFFDVSVGGTLRDQLPFALSIAGLTAAGFLLRTLLVLCRDGRTRAGHLLGAGTRPTALLDVARFVLFTVLAAHGYTWLKIFLPLINPALHDAALARMDAGLHFGLDVNRFVIELLPFPGLWRLIDGYYMLFLATVLLGLGWFASALSLKERARFAAGFALLWITGSWLYLAVPSLGPCYAFPADYETVRTSLPIQTATQETLLRHYRSIRNLRERGEEGMVVSPVLGVAAMPSLHVAGQAFFALFARRRSRPLFVFFTAATALTFYGSLVTGWHYAVDGYAGLLLGWLCVRVADRGAPGPR
ncbi:MAG TPA: phosphatase PAP2 family protein [Thermoanaerobaculia bacterium]|nr:phosphatase PAP2 family protein [Thermoanaerobaculia bacterium]